MLNRDDDHVYILGDCYAIEKTKEKTLTLGTEAQDSGRDYASEIDLLDNDLRALEKRIDDNPFVAEEDKIRVSEHVKEIYHDVAFTRQDTQKRYD